MLSSVILSHYPEQESYEALLPELIRITKKHSLPQIWEKCVEVILLLGKQIESMDRVALIDLLHSNPFPTLAPLALKLETL